MKKGRRLVGAAVAVGGIVLLAVTVGLAGHESRSRVAVERAEQPGMIDSLVVITFVDDFGDTITVGPASLWKPSSNVDDDGRRSPR